MTADDKVEESSDARIFMIAVPAIVVAVLIIVVISITVKVCSKKRASQQIIIKKTLEEAQQNDLQLEDET